MDEIKILNENFIKFSQKRWRLNNPQEPRIVFLHLHKCGGTAYLEHLSKSGLSYDRETNGTLHAKEWFYTPQQMPHDIVSYEASCPSFEYFQNCHTICIFRNPVDRLWSNYHYDLNRKFIDEMTFRDYCLSVKTANEGLFNLPNMYQRYFGGTIYLAKERIRRIDSILIFEEDLTDVEVHNKTHDKPQITEEDYNYAFELNRADMELYEYAKLLRGFRAPTTVKVGE